MAKFYTVPTAVGEAKIANAIALGRTLTIAELAIGDGNGSLPNPDSDRTSLVNQVRRAPINTSVVDDDNPNWIVVEQVIPPDEGGWTIREIGLFDSDGDMIAYGNYPETYKPVLSEGSGRTQTIRFVMQVSDTAAVTLKVDPSIVLATRKLVDDKIDEHAQSRNHPDATTTERGFVKKATRDATRQRSSTASVVTPGGLDGAMADHENASAAHRASQIALDKALDVFGDANTVQAVLALLGAAAKAANHNDIDGRDSSDAHPMSAISGLNAAISAINQTLNGLGGAATRNVGTDPGNVMEVGAFGLGAETAPILDDFANADAVGGLYRGFGWGTENPTPNGPPGTGNSRLSAYAINVGGGTHWIVVENAGSAAAHRLFFGNTHDLGVVWNAVWHDGNLSFPGATGSTPWARLPSGYMQQTGNAGPIPVGDSVVVTLPESFPNEITSVVATFRSDINNTDGAHAVYWEPINNGSFVLRHDDTQGTSLDLIVSWTATGY